MARRGPEVKQGTNRGQRVYWMECSSCGAKGKDHVAKVAAGKEKREHECNA